MDNSKFNKELDDSETIVRIIERAKDSAYWGLLDAEINKRMRYFQDYIELFQKNGIKTEAERLQYNRAVDNIDNLLWFKGLNEKILKDNQSIIERIKGMARETFRKVESFVK